MSVRVSKHAIARFRERTGCTKSDDEVRARLLDFYRRSREVRLKNRKYRTLALLNHDLREARYYRHGGFIFVVEAGVMTTVHDGAARRWKDAG